MVASVLVTNTRFIVKGPEERLGAFIVSYNQNAATVESMPVALVGV